MGTKKSPPPPAGKSASDPLITDLLGSAHVFAAAIKHVMEDRVLNSVSGEKSNFTRLKVLKLLSLAESHTVGDIAIFLGVSAAAASKTVEKLVRQGYVNRMEDALDRRAAQLLLTEAGRRVLDNYERERNSRMAKAFVGYSPADLRKATEVLDRLSGAIMNQAQHPEKTCLHCGVFFQRKNRPAHYTGCRVQKAFACDYLRHRERTFIDRAKLAGEDLG